MQVCDPGYRWHSWPFSMIRIRIWCVAGGGSCVLGCSIKQSFSLWHWCRWYKIMGRHTEWSTLYRQSDFTSIPLAGALCDIPARMDLCGARWATQVPSATAWATIFDVLERAVCLRFWTLGVCDWKAICYTKHIAVHATFGNAFGNARMIFMGIVPKGAALT